MIDCVVSGSRGFVGRRLMADLIAAGFVAVSDRDFAASKEHARLFINCANDRDHPLGSVALLRQKLDLSRGRTSAFVHLQSFVTLSGVGKADAARFNYGFRPHLLSPYALGKLLQEREISGRAAQKENGFLLVYIPAILGVGGSWDAVLSAARAAGFSLPSGVDANARANFVNVEDISAAIIPMLCDSPEHGAVRRIILNRDMARYLTWNKFLAQDGMAQQSIESRSIGGVLKQSVYFMILAGLGLAYRLGIFAAAASLLPLRQRATRQRQEAAVAIDKHVEFHGLTRYLVKGQGFIPPSF